MTKIQGYVFKGFSQCFSTPLASWHVFHMLFCWFVVGRVRICGHAMSSCHVVIAHPFHLRQQILGSALMLFSNQAADALLRNSVPYGIEVKDIQVDQMGAPNWTSFPNAVSSRSSSSCYLVACSPIQPLHQFPSTELSGSKLCIVLPCSNQAWLWMIPHLHPLTNNFPKLSKCLAFPLPG